MGISGLFRHVDTANENLSFGIVTVCGICALILAANVLRRKIPAFRRSLMPTAVIAGLLGLGMKETVLALTGVNVFNMEALGGLIYHLLPVAFIALCLRDKDDYAAEFDRGKVAVERVAAVRSGAVIISTYLLQGIVGILVTLFFALTFMPELNPATGIMLALGFGQGPQQANATGFIWDAAGHMDAWGPGSARNFGLTVAGLGFLWASIPGIVLANTIARRRGLRLRQDEFRKSGDLASYRIEGPDEIPLSESIDKFTLQVCMVCGVYLLTIGIILGIEIGFRASGVPFLIDLVPTIWGFAFMIAALVALCVRLVLRRLFRSGIMRRKYPNSYMMNRISGASFDLAIVAALCAISVGSLGTLWIPVLVMTTVGGLACMLYLRLLCNYVYRDYKDEGFLAMYGMLTGTIVNGMILLREIDGDFRTPAGDDLVLGSSAAIALGIPLLLLIAGAPRSGNLWWVMLVLVLYFAALLGFLFKDRLRGKRAGK